MLYNVVIDFNAQWISRNDRNAIASELFAEFLKEHYGELVTILSTSVTKLQFYIEAGEKAELEFELENYLRKKTRVSLLNGDAVMKITEIVDIANLLSDVFGKDGQTEKRPDFGIEPDPALKEYVDLQLNNLVGCNEFRELVNEICSVSAQIDKNNTHECFAFRNYLFSVNDGYGMSKYLDILSGVIRKAGLFKLSVEKCCEELQLSAARNESEREMYERHLISLKRCSVKKLVCFDISSIMSKTDTPAFRDFLKGLEDLENNFIFIFRVPFVENDVLQKIQNDISDVLLVKSVTVAPFTTDELVHCMRKLLSKYAFEITDEAVELFKLRLIEEKRDGRFYGVNTVNKVVNEMIYLKQLSNVRTRNTDLLISPDDIRDICTDTLNKNLTAEQQFNELAGIDYIRAQIYEIVDQIEFSLKNDKLSVPCINMRFVGNPGTGKTTVARIVGKLLKERGVLRNGSFFEYSGRDLCGRYIGETAPKTAAICRDAYGSVLFIDEAYALYKSEDDTRDYGKEAITTLIAEMENHRHDLVVIMAGYTKDMEILMQSNAGLASRMPYLIEFRSYSRDVLADIFMGMVKRNFEYDDELAAEVKAYFDNLSDEFINSPDFSNARYVRNIYEKTWSKAVTRCKIENCEKVILTAADFRRVIMADNNESLNTRNKIKIGF